MTQVKSKADKLQLAPPPQPRARFFDINPDHMSHVSYRRQPMSPIGDSHFVNFDKRCMASMPTSHTHP